MFRIQTIPIHYSHGQVLFLISTDHRCVLNSGSIIISILYHWVLSLVQFSPSIFCYFSRFLHSRWRRQEEVVYTTLHMLSVSQKEKKKIVNRKKIKNFWHRCHFSPLSLLSPSWRFNFKVESLSLACLFICLFINKFKAY